MDEQRMIDIETRLAYQEQALDELSTALADQQGQIGRLERLAERLELRLAALAESLPAAGAATDERPPHY